MEKFVRRANHSCYVAACLLRWLFTLPTPCSPPSRCNVASGTEDGRASGSRATVDYCEIIIERRTLMHSHLQPGYTIRHPTESDIPAIITVMREFDIAETGSSDAYSQEDLLRDWEDLDR